MPSNAMWSLQRVFNHSRSTKDPETKDSKPVPSHSSGFWKSANPSSFFLRRFSSTPCRSPKRSASAPQGLPQTTPPNPGTNDPPDLSPGEGSSCEPSISKSKSAPHAFALKPHFLDISDHFKPSENLSASDSTDSSPENIPSLSQLHLSPSSSHSDLSISNLKEKSIFGTSKGSLQEKDKSCTFPSTNPQEPRLPAVPDNPNPEPSPSKSGSSRSTPKNKSVGHSASSQHGSSPPSPSLHSDKMARPQSPHCRNSPSNSLHSSPLSSPLKSPPPNSSRRASTAGEQLPVTPSPPWSELMEARRRLIAVECRRRALCALETRVQQVHYVFLHAEMRVARQKEGLAKLVEAAGRAEVQTAVHGQRIRKTLRHHKPRLLACAMCVPCPGKSERRSAQHPRHSRCTLFQGRIQVLRSCVGSEDMSPRD